MVSAYALVISVPARGRRAPPSRRIAGAISARPFGGRVRSDVALGGQQLGDVDHARPQLAALDALLELPVAAGVDYGDHVQVRGGDLVEMRVEHARAVLGAHHRVGTRRAAAGGSARQLDVLADAREQLARLAPDAHPVAQVTRVLEPDPQAAPAGSGPLPLTAGASAPSGFASRARPRERSTIHCENSLTRSGPSTPARWAAHPPDVDTIVPGSASPSSRASVLAALQLAVVRVQRAAAALGSGRRELGGQLAARHD